jgi:hypothetical protein
MSSENSADLLSAVKAVGDAISDLLELGLTQLTGGTTGPELQALRDLLKILEGGTALAFLLMWARYIGVLAAGGKPKGSPERGAYDTLRAKLAEGSTPARVYERALSAFLDWTEDFFGDRDMAERTLFPHAFGLKTPVPLWTAPAFDRCLLLALIYPIAAIFLIWAISGHVGPAEAALGLKSVPDLKGWQWSLVVALIGFFGFALWRSFLAEGWRRLVWWLSGSAFAAGIIVAGAGAFAVASTVVVALASAVAFAVVVAAGIAGGASVAAAFYLSLYLALPIAFAAAAFYGAIAFSVAFSIAFAFYFASFSARYSARLSAGDFAVAFSRVGVGAVALAGGLAVFFAGFLAGGGYGAGYPLAVPGAVAVQTLYVQAIDRGGQGRFVALFSAAMIVAFLAAAPFLASLETWTLVGPLLLFVGLLTLLNAPFDWASLGLTRALELGGWCPYVLALTDACLAGVIIALLALTMVIGVQAFDELAMHGGGEKAAVLDLPKLFTGIEDCPAKPEYWWIYALLFSTMIPSLVNLMIGGTSLLRGIPGLPAFFLRFMPEGLAVPAFDRAWLAIALTGQIFLGAVLGIVAQAVLAWGLIFRVMPWIGLHLLSLCVKLADFNLPHKVAVLFTGGH